MSDLLIPPTSSIIAAAEDACEAGIRLNDNAAVRRLGTLIGALIHGAAFAWADGILVVSSPSGHTYHVSRASCDCPNGCAGQHSCWHWIARQLIEDMREWAAAYADDAAECPSPPPPPPAAPIRPIGYRLAEARAALYDEAAYWAEYRHERM